MSQEAKRVKILTLVELALGVVLIGPAIYLLVSGAGSLCAGLVGLDGVLTLVFGGKGALVANVPARMPQLVRLSIIALVAQVALVAAIVYAVGPDKVGESPVAVVCAAVPCVVTLVCLLLARGIAKRAER
jgi:hypothetical protein